MRKTCGSPEKEEQLDPRGNAQRGSEALSGVHCVPQVLVYLEVTTMSSFGVINLSRLILDKEGL